MIKHIHVDECHSTQDLLKEQLDSSQGKETFLVSCELQTSGHGRGGKSWTYQTGSLCFSLNLKPHKVMSFTALEIAVLIARFFETKGRSVKLKWPNDIWDNDHKKASGILVQGKDGHMLAGIGLNLFSTLSDFGGIYPEAFPFNRKEWAQDISQFILMNRYEDTDKLKNDWNSRCGHLNQEVRVFEGDEETRGIFLGLGEHGEATLNTNGKTVSLFNGSLRLT